MKYCVRYILATSVLCLLCLGAVGVGQGRSQKFVVFFGGGIKVFGDIKLLNRIAVLTSFLPHKSLLGLILGV